MANRRACFYTHIIETSTYSHTRAEAVRGKKVAWRLKPTNIRDRRMHSGISQPQNFRRMMRGRLTVVDMDGAEGDAMAVLVMAMVMGREERHSGWQRALLSPTL